MSNIFAIYNKTGFLKGDISNYIDNANILKHKDGCSTYRNINNKLLLYHNRIKDDDIQPIIKHNIMIIMDGMIYNYNNLYNDIKQNLPKYIFKTEINSEILIPLYMLYGSSFISKIRGAFSFVLYDATKNILIVVRDHIGLTSLYYAIEDDIFMISSEMKSLVNLSKNIEIFKPENVYINGNFFNHYLTKWKEENFTPTVEVNYDEIREQLINIVKKHIPLNENIGLLDGFSDFIIVSIIIYLKKNQLIDNDITIFTIEHENKNIIKESNFLNIKKITYTYNENDIIDNLENLIYHLETYDVKTIRDSILIYLLSIKIKKETNIRTLISGNLSDIIFKGTIEEKINKIKNAHKYNLLGIHKTTAVNSLELRLPFIDREFIDYIMNIKQHNDILKNMFYNNDSLSLDLESYKNENIKEILINYSNINILDDEFNNKEIIYHINTPKTKEELLYRKIFEKHYYHDCCVKIIDNNI